MKLDGVYQRKNKSRVYRSFRELELIAKLQISEREKFVKLVSKATKDKQVFKLEVDSAK